MRRKLSIFAAAAAALASGAALAHGAVAIGLPANYADEGFSTGQAYDYDSRDEATAVALEQCQLQAREFESPAQEAACRVVATFDDQCLAVAYDQETGTTGFGWAIAETQAKAEAEALADCKAASSPDRRAFCEITESDCDVASEGSA